MSSSTHVYEEGLYGGRGVVASCSVSQSVVVGGGETSMVTTSGVGVASLTTVVDVTFGRRGDMLLPSLSLGVATTGGKASS